MASVGGDQFDNEVELPCRGDDVVGLGPARDRVGRLVRRAGRLDADERLLVPEPERVGDGDDLQDPLCGQASVARANRRFGDPDPGGDRPERLAPVRLQRLDDAPVELVRPSRQAPAWSIVIPVRLEARFVASRFSRALGALSRSPGPWR